jgi:uncharacterized membrane protein YcaP (DUF421 family)
VERGGGPAGSHREALMTIHVMQVVSNDMFHLPVPIVEKILRPVIVYLCLIVFLRVFGKRELAQLNPFDLVVLLSLSNTVQNAIIGDDNSITGGIIGALALLVMNWLLTWLLFRSPKVDRVLEGSPTVLIRSGEIDESAMKHESLTPEELISVLNKNGFNDPAEVEICRLEPNGTFYVRGKQPSGDQVERSELMSALEGLRAEVMALREQLGGRG